VVKPPYIELGDGQRIPILYENRAVLAIDKPAGWMLVPFSWQNTQFNLQAAIVSSMAERRFWARSRNLRFLRYVHRLDAETTGVLLFAKSQGALETFSSLFATGRIDKLYLAVVQGVPRRSEWECSLKLAPVPNCPGRMQVDAKQGKSAHTHFRLIGTRSGDPQSTVSLVEARPFTGRTHQIRVHLAATGHPVVGDAMYQHLRLFRQEVKPRPRAPKAPPVGSKAPGAQQGPFPLGLRAVALSYSDPFAGRKVRIEAPVDAFLRYFGMAEMQGGG
jgi:RluA family pseudouridine synthase